MTMQPWPATVAQLIDGDDLTLLDEVGGRIQVLVLVEGKIAFRDLSPECRAILLIWESLIIQNGGFELLFEQDYPGDPGFIYMAAAFSMVGAPSAAAAFAAALAHFPENTPHADLKRRSEWYLSIPKAQRWENSRQFFRACDELVRASATFIRANRHAFLELPPSVPHREK